MDGFRTQLTDFASLASSIPDNPLGIYGNIPIAYAVFEITPDDEEQKSERAHFIYASPEYCRMADCELDAIIGCSHLEVVKSESADWASSCYRAAFLGETVNWIDYSALAQGWICFFMAPAAIEHCCICAFVPVSEQDLGEQLSVETRTTQVISEMLGSLAGESGYEAAMNGMLEMASTILNPDRLIVFECRGDETINTFEWCAKGIEPQLGTVYGLPTKVLNAWFKSVVKDPIALIPDVSVIAQFSPPLYEWCTENDVECLMAAPFINEGNVVGFLGAYNYHIDGQVDVNRVFRAISSFIGAKIDNRQLIENLAWTAEHDDLTGLFNRRGARAAFSAFSEKHPGESYVMALADIDDFKSTNDRYGHAAGDKALQTMAQTMSQAFSENAILCRTGGDEFQIVLVGESALQADELIKRFSSMEMAYEHEGVRRNITASVGYACYPEQAASRDELYTKADIALYAVKNAGKLGYKKYDPEKD